MKKLLLVIVMIATAATVQAQQLKTVRGKTKDGKTIVVRYYQGTYEDNIESVSYQVVDELRANVNNLQSQVRTLQGKLDEANRQIKQLNRRLETCGDQSDMEAIMAEIEAKTHTIDSLNSQLVICHSQILQYNRANDSLLARLDSVQMAMNATLNSRDTEKTPVIGLEVGIGQLLYGQTVNTGWNHEPQFSKRAAVYFGTQPLTESFPLSIEAGLGANLLGMNANREACQVALDNQHDVDGHSYQAQYQYSDLNETLSLTYLDIPIRICFGQPVRGEASVFAKIGITPSILLNSSFTGQGTYTKKGHYEQWQVTFEDIPELGFVSDASCYADDVQPELKRFVLWGNVSLGACVHLGQLPVQIQGGLKLDYPFMALGSATEVESLPSGMGLFGGEGKTLIPSVTFGLVYTLK